VDNSKIAKIFSDLHKALDLNAEDITLGLLVLVTTEGAMYINVASALTLDEEHVLKGNIAEEVRKSLVPGGEMVEVRLPSDQAS
jgi:hypothetical protein